MDEWMDGWMDGWMDEWMDGWMDGWRANHLDFDLSVSTSWFCLDTKIFLKKDQVLSLQTQLEIVVSAP